MRFSAYVHFKDRFTSMQFVIDAFYSALCIFEHVFLMRFGHIFHAFCILFIILTLMNVKASLQFKKKKMAWGPPPIHTRPLSEHVAWQVRKGGGGGTPKLYQATCPQHGGCLGAEVEQTPHCFVFQFILFIFFFFYCRQCLFLHSAVDGKPADSCCLISC